MSHTQQMELLPAPAVIGEAVILSSTFPEAAIRSCTFRQAGSCMPQPVSQVVLSCYRAVQTVHSSGRVPQLRVAH